MPSMMNETENIKPSKDWDALCETILELAHRRAESLARSGEDEDAFDRGARSLRTLMCSAEAASRMKRQEAKEQENDGEPDLPEVADDAIRALKRKLEKQIERIEAEDSAAAGRGDEGVLPALSREGLGSECA